MNDHRARRQRAVHGVLFLVWLVVVTPVVMLTGLKSSLAFVVFISLYAIWVEHAVGFLAGEAAVAAEDAP